ncbi:MAG: Mth938-like domain-containing protein [Pseudomonadota bacterium]
MVELTPLATGDRLTVEAYGDGGFRLGGRRHEGSLLVLPDQVLAWPVAEFAQITAEGLLPLWQAAPHLEILLLGCGPRLRPVAPALSQAVRAAGPVLEPMDTGAACRTYNLLLAEGRAVGAALIAVV